MSAAEQPAWRRSSGCTAGNCVEVAAVDGGFLIRDSKHPDMEPLRFTEAELATFAAAFVAGEFHAE